MSKNRQNKRDCTRRPGTLRVRPAVANRKNIKNTTRSLPQNSLERFCECCSGLVTGVSRELSVCRLMNAVLPPPHLVSNALDSAAAVRQQAERTFPQKETGTEQPDAQVKQLSISRWNYGRRPLLCNGYRHVRDRRF